MTVDASDVVFQACPVCGAVSHDENPVCGCHNRFDLDEYREIILASRSELDKARTLYVTEKYSEADAACVRAYDIWDGIFEESISLRTRIAIETAHFERARELLQSIESKELFKSLDEHLTEAFTRDRAAKERFNIALRSARRSEYQYAVSELLAAIDLAPYLFATYRLLIKVYVASGDFEKARTWLERAKMRFKDDSSIMSLADAVHESKGIKTNGFLAFYRKIDESPATRLATGIVFFAAVVASWVFALFFGR